MATMISIGRATSSDARLLAVCWFRCRHSVRPRPTVGMSGPPSIADIGRLNAQVRSVPQTDSCIAANYIAFSRARNERFLDDDDVWCHPSRKWPNAASD